MLDKLVKMEHCLLDMAEEALEHKERIHTAELGEVIDMIKDLEKTKYYYHVIAAMEHSTPAETLSKVKQYTTEQ